MTRIRPGGASPTDADRREVGLSRVLQLRADARDGRRRAQTIKASLHARREGAALMCAIRFPNRPKRYRPVRLLRRGPALAQATA